MKSFPTTLLPAIVLCLVFCNLSHADGILRQPAQHGDDTIFPLERVEVLVEIHEQVAITTVENWFDNTTDNTIRATYHYKLPETASVVGFGVWRDGQLFEYELRPGEQGGPGGGAGDNEPLEEYLGSNPFSMAVDSIQAGIFKVQLRYVELLPYDFGVINLTYPLNTSNWLLDAIDTVSINVQLSAQRDISQIEMTTYIDDSDLNVENPHAANANFVAYNLRPDEDWSMDITFSQEDIGAWLYTHRSDQEEAGYFMLVIEPGIVDEEEQVQKFFTFVMDRSGSMSGTKMREAKEAARCCLERLIDSDYFNIIDFATDIRKMNEELIEASDQNLSDANNYIGGIDSGGSTNINAALMEAISLEMGEGVANQILFMTDGRPTVGIQDAAQIIENVTEGNESGARIFCFGIGNDVNPQLLAGLSEENHGQCLFLNAREQSIDDSIDEFYRYISSPALVEPELEFPEGFDTDEIFPRELQDVASGKQLMIFGRYNAFGEQTISLSGYGQDGDTTMVFEDLLFPEETNENSFVPRMWAKTVIDYWMRWMLINGERQDIIDDIIELSIKYGILTRYTEFEPPENPVFEPKFKFARAQETKEGVMVNWQITGIASPAVYNVYRSLNVNSGFTKLNDTPLNSTQYLDVYATPGLPAYYKIEMIVDGVSYMSAIIVVNGVNLDLVVGNASPNPFNSKSLLRYNLISSQQLTISLFDIHGHEIERIFDGRQTAGGHTVTLNGECLPTGRYLLRFKTDDQIAIKSVVMIK